MGTVKVEWGNDSARLEHFFKRESYRRLSSNSGEFASLKFNSFPNLVLTNYPQQNGQNKFWTVFLILYVVSQRFINLTIS